MFTVVNILSGNAEHKAGVIASDIPLLVVHHLKIASHEHCGTGGRGAGTPDIRIPAMWCIINMTRGTDQASVLECCARLKNAGIVRVVQGLADDEGAGMDLQERARTAIEQLG